MDEPTQAHLPLGQLTLKIGSGSTPRGGSAVYQPTGTPFIRSQNVWDHEFRADGLVFLSPEHAQLLRAVAVRPGDVLMNITGDSVARVCLAPEVEARVSQHVAILRPMPGIVDSRFLVCALAAPSTKGALLATASSGATRPALTKAQLERLPIPLPPIRIQEVIGDVAGAIAAKADANAALAKSSTRLAAGLLQTTGTVSTPRTSEVATVRRGLSYKGSGLAVEGMPMVNLANVRPFGGLKREGFKYYTEAYKPRHMARAGDLLVANTDLTWKLDVLGWPMLVPDDMPEVLFSHHVSIIDFHPGNEWMRLPLWAYLFTTEARGRVEAFAHGTTVAALPSEALEGMAFPLPARDDPVLPAAEALLPRAWAAERESAALVALRDALLPELVSGRIRVRDLDQIELAEAQR